MARDFYGNRSGRTFSAEIPRQVDARIQKWREVATLLEQGWRLDGDFDLVSPDGKRRSAWGNAIKACRDRGLVP